MTFEEYKIKPLEFNVWIYDIGSLFKKKFKFKILNNNL